MKEAKYPEGDIRNHVLRDMIISGLASDKICAKVIKEGEDIMLARGNGDCTIGGINAMTSRSHARNCQSQLREVWKRLQG